MSAYLPKVLEFDHTDTPSPATRFTVRIRRVSDDVQVHAETVFVNDTNAISRVGNHFTIKLSNACLSPEAAGGYDIPEGVDLRFHVQAQNAAGGTSTVTPGQPFQFVDAPESVAPVLNVTVA